MAAASVILPGAGRLGALAIALTVLLPGGVVSAEGIYAGGDIAYTRMPVTGRDYTSYAAKFRLGAMHASGWGIEAQALGGLGDDTNADIKIGIDTILAAFVRYEYPQDADFQLYALAGYAWTSISIDGPNTEGLEDSFGDFSYALGLQEKLVRWKNTTAIVEFGNYLGDNNVDLWSISAGLRYEF